MPRFTYTAIDDNSRESTGIIEASTASDASSKLRETGLYPTSVTLDKPVVNRESQSGRFFRPLTNNERIQVISIIVLVGGLFLFSNLLKRGHVDIQSSGASLETVESALSVQSASLRGTEFGGRVITGSVVNNSSKRYSYVQVSINLYDSNGVQVGNTLANINNLETGRTWTFEAPVLEHKVTNFKIIQVTFSK